ncbi:hypothetical protein [Nostoc sp.]|uniref:hypothetical protein n=1 Tax=Nostoc sp. TaxID=1180 RepID=UPI002FF73CB0
MILYVVIHIAPEGAIAQVKVGRSPIAVGWVDNLKFVPNKLDKMKTGASVGSDR